MTKFLKSIGIWAVVGAAVPLVWLCEQCRYLAFRFDQSWLFPLDALVMVPVLLSDSVSDHAYWNAGLAVAIGTVISGCLWGMVGTMIWCAIALEKKLRA